MDYFHKNVANVINTLEFVRYIQFGIFSYDRVEKTFPFD